MPIEAYEFGRIVVDGQTYTADLILLPDRVQDNWWRREGHQLHPDDLSTLLDSDAEVLVVGQGRWGRMRVLPETEQLLRERGIELVALDTAAACQVYNQRRAAGARVAAALHLTC
jgi:hypothetical protein